MKKSRDNNPSITQERLATIETAQGFNFLKESRMSPVQKALFRIQQTHDLPEWMTDLSQTNEAIY